ncbi:MAG: hypothetical protein GY765_31615 [bacterium]|nr:hypothetical protein [bacterium]
MIKTLPSKEGEDVNWEELLQNKEKAEKALNQLFIMFSAEPTDVKLVGCIWLEPAI